MTAIHSEKNMKDPQQTLDQTFDVIGTCERRFRGINCVLFTSCPSNNKSPLSLCGKWRREVCNPNSKSGLRIRFQFF